MHTAVRARPGHGAELCMFETAPADQDLVERVAARDKRALELLYDKHAPAALGLAAKMVGERNVAEEIVQEAFWRVWKRAESYTASRGTFTTWLFGIVHNLAVDELRKHHSAAQSNSVELEGEWLAGMADLSADVAESAIKRLTGEQVRVALTTLPDSQRSVIELAFFEGLTHQEIADKLGEPLGTVHTRARLALAKLREELRPLYRDGLIP